MVRYLGEPVGSSSMGKLTAGLSRLPASCNLERMIKWERRIEYLLGSPR